MRARDKIQDETVREIGLPSRREPVEKSADL